MADTDIQGTIGYGYDPAALRAAADDSLRLADATGKMRDEFGRFTKGADDAGASAKSAAVQLHSVVEVGHRVKEGMDAAWGAMGQAVSVSAEYEKTLAQVSTLSDEAAGKQGEYRAEILRVSTALGTDAVASANALYDALSSGIPANNALSFMETASKAAVAGATDVGSATRGITTALNAWKLDASEASQVSDVFFQGVNVGVFRFEELSNSIGQVAPLAASMGISYKEVTAATASLTKQGLSASEAITQQRASISAILTPNKQMSEVLQQLALDNTDVAKTAEAQGLSIGEAAVKVLGYQGTMEALRESSSNAGIQLATATGSVQALGAVLGLTGDNAAGARDDLETMNGAAGSTNKAFAIMEETFSGAQDKLEAIKQRGMIELGGAIQSALLPALQAAIGLLGPMVEWFSKWSDGAKTGAGVVVLLAGGLGTLVTALILGKAAFDALGVSALITATHMSKLQLAMAGTGIGVAILAIGALVAALSNLRSAQAAAYEATAKAEGGFDAYVAAQKRATDQATGLSGVLAKLDSTSEGMNLQRATEAWLQYGLGVDDATMKTKDFKEAQFAAGQEWQKTGDVEAYKAAMLRAADAASMAADKGHVLSEAQRTAADAWAKSTQAVATNTGGVSDATIKSEKYQKALRDAAAAQALNPASADKHRASLLALGQAMDEIAAKTEESTRKQAEAAGVVQTYGDSFSTLLRAGSQWTDDAEAMAKAQEDADAAMATSVQQTLGQMWQARKDYSVKLAEAEAEDAKARAKAAQSSGGGGDSAKRALEELKFANKMQDLADAGGRAKTDAQRAANARDVEIARAAHAIKLQDQQRHEGQMVGAVQGGGRVAAVQAEYNKELASAKEALAQTVVEYVKTQVLLGQTSEETARKIFTELKAGFPGIEIINPVEEASLGLMAAVHDAAAGVEGGFERIKPAIDGSVEAMVAAHNQDALMTTQAVGSAAERAAAYTAAGDTAAAAAALQADADARAAFAAGNRSQAVLDALGAEGVKRLEAAGVGDSTAAQHTAADQAVTIAGLLRMQAAGESLTAEQQAMLDTATVAKTSGAQTGTAMLDVGNNTQAAAGNVAAGTGRMKTDVGSVPGAVRKAADDVKAAAVSFGDGFTVAAQKAQEGQRQTLGALEETLSRQKSGMDETTRAGLAGESAHKQIATAAGDSKKAVTDYGDAANEKYTEATRAAKENEEQTKKLATALRDLPRDVRIQFSMIGIDKFTTDIRQIKADLADLPEVVNIRVVAQTEGFDGPLEPRHSLQLQHDLEDVYAVVADNGPIIVKADYLAANPAMQMEGGILGVTTGLWGATSAAEAFSQMLNDTPAPKLGWQVALEEYYAWLAQAPERQAKFDAVVNAAMGPGGSWESIMAEWADKSIGGMGWMNADELIASGKIQPPDPLLLAGDPEMAKKEWERFWSEVNGQETERHQRTMAYMEAQSQRFDQSTTSAGMQMAENYDKWIDEEKQRHEDVTRHIDIESTASDNYFARNEAFFAELARLRKVAEDAIKADQKAYVDAENDAHRQVTEQIEDEVRRRKEYHDVVNSGIEERKRIEAEAYAAASKALDEQARQIKLADEQRARDLADYKASVEKLKVDVDIDGAKRKLEELKTTASQFGEVLGKLERVERDPKKAADEERKRQAERVKLTTQAQRDMLAQYRDMASAEDQRTVDLLLAGYNVKAVEAERIMAAMQARLQDSVGDQEKVVDAKEQELLRLQGLITAAEEKAKVEKRASEDQLKVIEDIKRQSAEAHTEYVRQLDLEKRQEDERYKAESAAIAKLKDAEGDRHAANLKRINEEHALRLLQIPLEGETKEEAEARVARILKEQGEQAKRISDEADKRYREAIAAVDAESARLQGQQKANEESVRQRVADMQRDLIERMRLIAQAIGGEAGAAIDEMLRKLLDEATGIPSTGKAWEDAADRAVASFGRISEAIKLVTKSIGEAYTEEDAAAEKARAEKRKGHWETPDAKLNASTRRGRGGFRAGNDWTQWHGTWVPDPDDSAAGGTTTAPPPPTTDPPGSGRKTLPIEPPTNTGMPPGHGIEPDPWRYGLGGAGKKETNPWRYGSGGGKQETNPWRYAETNPWRYAKGNSPTDPLWVAIVEGATGGGTATPGLPGAPPTEALVALLSDMTAATSAMASIPGIGALVQQRGETSPAPSERRVNYNHYGDNNLIGNEAVDEFFDVALHLAP